MKPENRQRKNPGAFPVLVPVLILLIPLVYSVVSHVFAGGDRTAPPFLERPDEKYENCVRDASYMRFHHWELLIRIREEVVRDGKRGEVGLHSCRECHPNRDRFCNRCHAAVNLHPDCFGCHYYPESVQAAPDEPAGGEIGSAGGRPVTDAGPLHGR